MKTFTRTLAALFAVSLALLALSACKKVQPTELTEATTTATVVKGTIAYLKTKTDGTDETTYSTPTAENIVVTVTTHIKTGNFIEDEKGNKVEETIASVQKVPFVDKMFEANVPVAPGETYDVEVRCEFESKGYQKIGKGTTAVSGTIKYKAVEKKKVAYGQIFVSNLTAEFDGFEQSSGDGTGADSKNPE